MPSPATTDARILEAFARQTQPCAPETALGKVLTVSEAESVQRLWSDGRLLQIARGLYSVNPEPPPLPCSRPPVSGYGAAVSRASIVSEGRTARQRRRNASAGEDYGGRK